MNNRHPAPQRQLQRHIDVEGRVQPAPVFSAFWKESVQTGGDIRTSSAGEVKSPRYADVGQETMKPELIMQYRARIASGVYDAPASIHALAQALLASYEL